MPNFFLKSLILSFFIIVFFSVVESCFGMELLDGYGMAFEDFKNELWVQVFSYDKT